MNTFHRMKWFAILSTRGTDMTVLQTLALSRITDAVSRIMAPFAQWYVMCEGELARKRVLKRVARSKLLPQLTTPVADLIKGSNEP